MTVGKLSLLLALPLAVPAAAQHVISARAGYVNYWQGAVTLPTGPDEKIKRQIAEGQSVTTERGRLELLLTPGSFLRLDRHSTVRLLSSRLADVRVELVSGTAMLEVNETRKGTSIVMLWREHTIPIKRTGLYRFEAAQDSLRVHVEKGKLRVPGKKGPLKGGGTWSWPRRELPARQSSTTGRTWMSLTVGTGSDPRNWPPPPMQRSIVSAINAPPYCPPGGPASGSSIPGSATTPSCRTATQSDRPLALFTVALVLVMSIDNPPGMGIPAEPGQADPGPQRDRGLPEDLPRVVDGGQAPAGKGAAACRLVVPANVRHAVECLPSMWACYVSLRELFQHPLGCI